MAQPLLSGEQTVFAQEKVDGSQFSFGVDETGLLYARSKGKELDPHNPQEKMFNLACETVGRLAPALHPGWTYRGEYLRVPKHNTLTYARVPKQHIILYDINFGHESYLPPRSVAEEAERLELECVPWLATTGPEFQLTLENMQALLATESILGGTRIEGVVIKPYYYDLFGPDKKVVMAKYVSEQFKEMHQKDWKLTNPSRADVVQMLVQAYKTDARWTKAVQRLRDDGVLQDDPKDIGPLMKALQEDLAKECKDDAAQALLKHFWPQIARGATAGFAEWYKERLLQSAFTEQP
jgi:hypothetical protein